MKEINTNCSSKIESTEVEKQDNFEVKELLEKMLDHVLKYEKEVIEIADEDKRPAANNRRGTVYTFYSSRFEICQTSKMELFLQK